MRKPDWQSEDGRIQLYCGDCLEILPELGKVDAIATDPPYGVEYRGGHFHCGDVSVVNKRDALEGDDSDIYTLAIPAMLAATPGPIYSFFAGTKAHCLYAAIDREGADLHAMIVWHKVNATYAAMNSQYKQRHEPCVYFKRRGGHTRWCGPSNERTVWEIPRDPANDLHPTQKPVALFARMMFNHTCETWCDPFMGSGSCGVAAVHMERRFVGIELDKSHFRTACRRIEQAILDHKGGPLFEKCPDPQMELMA